ncbi:MAG: hypothetical protein KGJ78_09420 [Alphaproteobacteria bacterium]|nr:hypothetical protein [Alphaproteobacteria bacterium]
MISVAEQALSSPRTNASRLQEALISCYRYGLSTLGPVAVSGAHFVASLIFLRLLRPEDFGQFSFLLIVVPFCLSATGALLGAPASLTRGKDEATAQAEIATLQKASLVVSLLAGGLVTALMLSTGAGWDIAPIFGLYGAASTLRSFGRSLSNVRARLLNVAGSDLVYAAAVISGLVGLVLSQSLSLHNAAIVFAMATVVSFAPFGASYFRGLLQAVRQPILVRYLPMWRDIARWSVLGVVLTEVTANAHAYFVTFLCGPRAFGLLALGALFMRPVSLVLSALPDIDQPVMARRLALRDTKGAFKVVKEFRTAAGAVLASNVLLSAAILIWFPQLLLRKHYDFTDVLVVLALWVGVTLLRVVRTPEAVFIQATGGYRELARISAWSGATSVAVTFILLCLAGPVASLGGVLAGEIVIVATVFPLTRRWRAAHG